METNELQLMNKLQTLGVTVVTSKYHPIANGDACTEHEFHYRAEGTWNGGEYAVISSIDEYDALTKLYYLVQIWFGLR